MSKPLVVLVAPERPGNVHERGQWRQTETLRADANRAATARGWKTRTFRTKLHRSTRPGESSRPLQLLGGWDAADIYELTHREDVAVIQIGETARVMPHPRQEPSLNRAITLADFVRHKAFFAVVSARVPHDDALDRFAATFELVECDGERDPRCLPMHVFAPKHNHDAYPLTDAAAFKRKYGSPTERTDHSGRLWAKPNGRHGGGALRIRGAAIAAGFHWDVCSTRNASELTTTVEIWSLPPGSYVNVTPNATVRIGQRSARAAAKKSLTLARSADARETPAGRRPSTTASKGSRKGQKR